MEEKDDLLPVSKDCLQQGMKTEEVKKCSVQSNDISFNVVAHSGLIEEAFSGHCHDRFQLGFFSVFLHTHCFYMLQGSNLHSLAPLSNTQEVAHVVVAGKTVASCCYLFRLTRWMLLQTPSPPLKHSAKSSHFPLNHQTGPMLS